MPTQFSSSAGTVRGLTRAALCTACACLLAPVSIPIGPVSLTLGVFAILLAGALLPPVLAALSACAYLLLGFAGLPVFAGFAAGPGVLFGMTGGYLLAYPIMAWLLSMVCEKTRSRGVRMAGVALANLCCYLLGTAWFMDSLFSDPGGISAGDRGGGMGDRAPGSSGSGAGTGGGGIQP